MVAKKRIFTKKNILIAIGVLLVVAAITGAVLYYTSAISSNSKQPAKEVTPEEKIATIINKAESAGGTATTEKQELKKLAADEPDKTKKNQYLSAVVDLYVNTNDIAGAQTAAQEYEKSAESAQSADALAKAYYDAGDYRNAAKYYGIAADRSEKPISVNERAPYNDYMNLKQEAEAKIQ